MMLSRFGMPMTDRFGLMNALVNDVLFGSAREARGWPAVNLMEDGERLVAEAEAPGLTMEDLEILVVGDELTLKGHRRPMSDREVTFHRRERGTGEFARVITLPMAVDADKVEAVLKEGVLTITLPKAEAAKPRKITVKQQ